MLQKNQKQTEQQFVKTLLEQQQQQQQQQQPQFNEMPPLEYATLSPTRVQYLHEQQPKVTTTTTTTTRSFSHLPNCKYHAINQQQPKQQQQQHFKTCQHSQQQHRKSCQHSSPQQQLHANHHHHHHHHQHQHEHHHHRQHKPATLQPQQLKPQPQQPVYHHHTLNLQESKNRKRDYTIKTQHYKSSPEINRTATSPTITTTTPTAKSQLWISLPLPVANKKGIRRCRSYYNSFEDLDAKTRAEKRVVASLKYLCACTGATLRNLSKKTKNLHATQQQFTFTYTKVNKNSIEKGSLLLQIFAQNFDNPRTLVC